MKPLSRATLFHALLPAMLAEAGYLAAGLFAVPFVLLFLLNAPLFAMAVVVLTLAALAAAAGHISLWLGLANPTRGVGWRGAAQLMTILGAVVATVVCFGLHLHFARPGTSFNTEYWTAWVLVVLVWFAVTGPLLALAWSRPWLRDQPPGLSASKPVVLACWLATAVVAWVGHTAMAASIAQHSGRDLTPLELRTVDPVAAHLCAGNLAAASRALDAAGWSQSVDARKVVERCVADDGWYARLTSRQKVYPERLPLAIRAVVASIRSQQFADDCGPLHVALLQRVVQIDPLALPLMSNAGLHILCRDPDGDRPVWWTALQTSDDPETLRARVRALDRARVQWDDRDRSGQTLPGGSGFERFREPPASR